MKPSIITPTEKYLYIMLYCLDKQEVTAKDVMNELETEIRDADRILNNFYKMKDVLNCYVEISRERDSYEYKYTFRSK